MNSENPESAPQTVRFQDAQAMYDQGQLETKGEKKSVAPQRGERLAPRYCRRLLPSTLSQIGDREVNLHIILHFFRMHHFVV